MVLQFALSPYIEQFVEEVPNPLLKVPLVPALGFLYHLVIPLYEMYRPNVFLTLTLETELGSI